MDVLIFLLILSFLVIIHELGHFLTARRFGMKTLEFGIGYPPRAWTWFKDKLGTEYTLNWLPFGGFVRLYGEDGEIDEADKKSEKAKEGLFFTKPVWQRIVVVVAGAAVNFLFGVMAFGAIYSYIGIPTQHPYAIVKEVADESPAQAAGLKQGDKVVAIMVGSEQQVVGSASEFIEKVSGLGGQTINLLFDDGGEVSVYVRTKDEIPAGQGAIGVSITDFELKHYAWYEMPFRGMAYGLKAAVEFGGLLLNALGSMVWQLVSRGEVPKDVSGPVGIAYIAQKEGILTAGWLERINFAAILSINLAIVNVLPIPALDGGRLVFLVWEGVFRKRVKPDWERKVNTVGFLALVSLLLLITVRDAGRVMAELKWDWLTNLGGKWPLK